jgi:CRISPR system Cascade subunit CasD
VWWPTTPDAPRPTTDGLSEDTRYPVTDRRDWTNQIHVGERWLAEGTLMIEPTLSTHA